VSGWTPVGVLTIFENRSRAGVDFFKERPVSSEISDFTPCMHEKGNILHTKYVDKTDY